MKLSKFPYLSTVRTCQERSIQKKCTLNGILKITINSHYHQLIPILKLQHSSVIPQRPQRLLSYEKSALKPSKFPYLSTVRIWQERISQKKCTRNGILKTTINSQQSTTNSDIRKKKKGQAKTRNSWCGNCFGLYLQFAVELLEKLRSAMKILRTINIETEKSRNNQTHTRYYFPTERDKASREAVIETLTEGDGSERQEMTRTLVLFLDNQLSLPQLASQHEARRWRCLGG